MDAFGIAAQPVTNHNLAPTEPLLVIRPTQTSVLTTPETAGASTHAVYEADELRWWLTPSWSGGPSTKYAMFNAKSETLLEKRSFARPFRSQRCVVPVTGYYEWKRGSREKLPFYVHAADDRGLLLAGLWDSWTDKATGEVIESCSIVTAAAAEPLEVLHHRQPVFLSHAEALAWLDHSSGVEELGLLMTPHLPNALQLESVSTHVNNARNKDERCVQPIAEPLLIDDSETNPELSAGLVDKHPDEFQKQDLFDVD